MPVEMTRRRWILFGVIDLFVITVVVVAVVLLTSGDDSGSSLEPRILSPAQLSEFAAERDAPVYWLGERAGARYELTDADDGKVFVRYLRGEAKAGEKGAGFITVATYPAADPLAELRRAAGERDGARLVRTPGGATVLLDPSSPDNAHLAYPGNSVQVEVYSPVPGQALRLASRGAVVPVP
jgi:hypothetical protein